MIESDQVLRDAITTALRDAAICVRSACNGIAGLRLALDCARRTGG